MNEQGYTLLEVMLFMAISGLLVLVAFIGLSSRFRNVRFTDATRAIESSVSREFATSQLGESRWKVSCKRDAAGRKVKAEGSLGSGESEDCVRNGVLALFLGDKIQYYSIASAKEQFVCTSTENQSTANKLFCHGPTILGSNAAQVQEEPYKHGLSNVSGNRAIFYLQDPNGVDRYIYGLSNTSFSPTDTTVITVGQKQPVPAQICFRLSSRTAALQFRDNSFIPEVNHEATC